MALIVVLKSVMRAGLWKYWITSPYRHKDWTTFIIGVGLHITHPLHNICIFLCNHRQKIQSLMNINIFPFLKNFRHSYRLRIKWFKSYSFMYQKITFIFLMLLAPYQNCINCTFIGKKLLECVSPYLVVSFKHIWHFSDLLTL